MEFKKGLGWKACYDEERNLYTAERGGPGAYNLYEITKEIYDQLEDGAREIDVYDRCGPPYTVVFDHDYEKLCPWAKVISSGKVWPDELTDAAVEIFESEKNNREQRRKRRENSENS